MGSHEQPSPLWLPRSSHTLPACPPACQAELEEAERRAEAERQRRADRQRVTYERRMLREVLGWIRGAARAPHEVNWNK